MRLLFALVLLITAHLLLKIPLPLNAGSEHWLWLTISGSLGLIMGDAFLFQAFIWIGPRLSMLLMSLNPAIAAVMAWIFLGEWLNGWQILGILITLSGITWVVLERNGKLNQSHEQNPNYLKGVLFGLGAAFGQAAGLVTAKKGLADGFPALSATLLRFIAAFVILWGYTLVRGQVRSSFQRGFQYPRSIALIAAGATTGPLLGVTLSMLAIQHAEVGIASTLMALPPLILLPISYFLYKERFGWQAIVGTVIALVGVGMLFLV